METNGHWYDSKTGEPHHFIAKKDGTGNRPTTLRDARANGWIPSVTTILKVLDRPALRAWMVREAVYAITTAPDVPGEDLDAKIKRVLETERQQDEESQKARDRGTDIHAALESYFLGQDVAEELRPWIEPAAKAIAARGALVTAEKILVGDGYAGKTDLIQEAFDCWWIVDWKSTKTLPDPKKGAWSDHRLQASGYAAAFYRTLGPFGGNRKPIRTCNVYVSTVEPGAFVICDHDPDWQKAYQSAFLPLLKVWSWMNNYIPPTALL